ncbi:DUF6816 family protein [Chamaesiphon sp. OTE_75_metabat_556]|uniref:DUF6816 family protein n=1 Tax=Chamaesiphon sp. OTE_75_metabat_556 TaxID=2964692 RepID=UPI00286CE722|nr:hypothetical protein [Chamaesiphon sp. OTE_75_metabat_556]
MHSLVRKMAIWSIAIACWFCISQSALAGVLSDRIDRYPNWDAQPQLSQHDGELTYPEWFRGRWLATSTLLEQSAPLAPKIVTPGFESNRQYIDKPIKFTVQFIPTDLTKSVKFSTLSLPRLAANLPKSKLIADRAFNGLNIATAYLGASNVKSVAIDSQNPTKQITQLTQDRQLEAFVTGFDREIPTLDQFIAAEVSQQVFRTSSTIYLNTVETITNYQFSPTPTPTITATQISAVYLSPQDPDYFRSIDRAVAIYKYRLDLVPI